MLILGHGRIYVNQGEPLPFVCPECDSPVPYSTDPYVRCTSCGLYTDRCEFQLVGWEQVLPN